CLYLLFVVAQSFPPAFSPPPAAPRPAVHPSPTRRSSDLRCAGFGVLQNEDDWAGRPHDAHHRPVHRRSTPNAPRGGRTAVSSRRSEEHTSELQSRFDLVCRLLLEKKKNGAGDRHQERECA